MPGKRGNPAWAKGQSGNPGGRPKGENTLLTKCREWADKFGFEALAKLATDDTNPRVQITATQYIIDRAYGKTPETIKHEGFNTGPDLSGIPIETLKKIRAIMSEALIKKPDNA